MTCIEGGKMEISQTKIDKIGQMFHRRRKFDGGKDIRSFKQIAEMVNELFRKTEGIGSDPHPPCGRGLRFEKIVLDPRTC